MHLYIYKKKKMPSVDHALSILTKSFKQCFFMHEAIFVHYMFHLFTFFNNRDMNKAYWTRGWINVFNDLCSNGMKFSSTNAPIGFEAALCARFFRVYWKIPCILMCFSALFRSRASASMTWPPTITRCICGADGRTHWRLDSSMVLCIRW